MSETVVIRILTFTTLWAYLADDKLIFLLFTGKYALTFHTNCLQFA